MTTMARIKPRRKPRLRLVGEDGATRHANIMTLAGQDWVVEAWTFLEYDALAECERPEQGSAILLPGLGFVAVRVPLSWMEREDILDMQRQAKEQRDERGSD
jgi:hypothetical protein